MDITEPPSSERPLSASSSSSRGKLITAPRFSAPPSVATTGGATAVAAKSRRRSTVRRQESGASMGFSAPGHAKISPLETQDNSSLPGDQLHHPEHHGCNNGVKTDLHDRVESDEESVGDIKQVKTKTQGQAARPTALKHTQSFSRRTKKLNIPQTEEEKEVDVDDDMHAFGDQDQASVDDDQRINQRLDAFVETNQQGMQQPTSTRRSSRTPKLSPLVTSGNYSSRRFRRGESQGSQRSYMI